MHVLSNSPDPRFGGPWKRSLDVAKELRPLGVETVFLVSIDDDSFVDIAEDAGFECIRIRQPRIRSPRRLRANARFVAGFRQCARKVRRIVESHQFEVVHANGPLNYAVALASARSDSSLVWHFNDTLTPTPFKEISAYLAKRWADERVVAANAVHDHFFDNSVRTRTIYPPVDLKIFDPSNHTGAGDSVRDELGIPDQRTLIGTIGNINPAKGYQYLIESYADICQSHDAHLVIVGKRLDSQRRYYKQLRRKVRQLGIESRVTFAGWRNDVPRLLARFDLFVLASVTEACPIVVLEAMAMQCPVVATDVGGVNEQIPNEKHGWVVSPANASALTAAIQDALSSRCQRRENAERARSRVERIFALDQCVENHLEMYKTAIIG